MVSAILRRHTIDSDVMRKAIFFIKLCFEAYIEMLLFSHDQIHHSVFFAGNNGNEIIAPA